MVMGFNFNEINKTKKTSLDLAWDRSSHFYVRINAFTSSKLARNLCCRQLETY
ncbi:unnamed protein product [Arabidopsis halleri]